jgi:hypothetical protein
MRGTRRPVEANRGLWAAPVDLASRKLPLSAKKELVKGACLGDPAANSQGKGRHPSVLKWPRARPSFHAHPAASRLVPIQYSQG